MLNSKLDQKKKKNRKMNENGKLMVRVRFSDDHVVYYIRVTLFLPKDKKTLRSDVNIFRVAMFVRLG